MASATRNKHRSRSPRSRSGALMTASGALSVFDGQCANTLRGQGREVLATGDPLEAEMWGSYLLGMFSALPLIGEPDPAEAIGGRLVSVAQRQRTPEALMCLRAIAAVAGEGLARKARKALAGLAAESSRAPAWTRLIGSARATSAWRASDAWGDQDSWIVGFKYPDGAEHCVMVLVDHLLGGIAKDVAMVGRPLLETLEEWGDLDLAEESIGEAAGRIEAAMAVTEHGAEAPVDQDLYDGAALLKARLGPLAEEISGPALMSAAEREGLARAFLAADHGRRFADDPEARPLVDALIDWRCDAGADPLLWSCSAVESFLLDAAPARLVAPLPVLRQLPEVLAEWVPWAAARAGLPAFLAQESVALFAVIGEEALEALSDPAQWCPAKAAAMRQFVGGRC